MFARAKPSKPRNPGRRLTDNIHGLELDKLVPVEIKVGTHPRDVAVVDVALVQILHVINNDSIAHNDQVELPAGKKKHSANQPSALDPNPRHISHEAPLFGRVRVLEPLVPWSRLSDPNRLRCVLQDVNLVGYVRHSR